VPYKRSPISCSWESILTATLAGCYNSNRETFAKISVCLLFVFGLIFVVLFGRIRINYSAHYSDGIYDNIFGTGLITTVTMQLSGRSLLIESVRSDLPLRGHNYGVCYATVGSPHPRCSAGIQSMFQPATAATRPQSTFRGTRACIMPKMR